MIRKSYYTLYHPEAVSLTEYCNGLLKAQLTHHLWGHHLQTLGSSLPECRINPNPRSLYCAVRRIHESRNKGVKAIMAPLTIILNETWGNLWFLPPTPAQGFGLCRLEALVPRENAFLPEDRARVSLSCGCRLDLMDSVCPGPIVRKGVTILGGAFISDH